MKESLAFSGAGGFSLAAGWRTLYFYHAANKKGTEIFYRN
jgi:hypothetical protein